MNQFEYDEDIEAVSLHKEGQAGYVAFLHGITSIEEDDQIPNRWRLKSNLRTVATLWDCERKEEGK